MQIPALPLTRTLALASVLVALPAFAADAPAPTPTMPMPSAMPTATPSADAASETKPAGWQPGLDLFYGVSNQTGAHRYRDGMWIGFGPAYPSTAYLRYEDDKGRSGRISAGLGKLHNTSAGLLRQPEQAWFAAPSGKFTITAGKYYVPMGILEWEYETKWGVMAQNTAGSYDTTVSANYNGQTKSANVYSRFGRSFGEKANLGLSLGAGRGMSYDTSHDRGVGLDATLKRGGWELQSEYMFFRNPQQERFHFRSNKLLYHHWGRLQPFLQRVSWDDSAAEQGRFRSLTAGLTYQLRPDLTLQVGTAATSDTTDHNVTWAELHWTWEP